ncbi:hypothetical protein [Rathayibacter sp. VKM Ac-2801]|uniref:hypothetical protein n=1 Tax=Rathayibacter sp. VKM Ac-2801 TaxID=2609255 RepID=UPI00131F8204|nr:hypothetical protein [Rathayibacter sp. VKM Ac-2801]QHC69336.1 hypothetical protein GSU45_02340 [Rathayibacter sp. VKM Ac-2801]
MAESISTTPAPAGGKARSGSSKPFPIPTTSRRTSRLTLLDEEHAREARFWRSYDAAPSSATAWADAAATAWRSAAARAQAERDIDRWNDEGGSAADAPPTSDARPTR